MLLLIPEGIFSAVELCESGQTYHSVMLKRQKSGRSRGYGTGNRKGQNPPHVDSTWRKFLSGECFSLHFGPTLAANFVASCFTNAGNQGDESGG